MTISGSEQQRALDRYGADVIWQKIEDAFNSQDFSELHHRMSVAQQVYDLGITLPDKSSVARDSAVYTSVIPREFVDKVVTQLSETAIVVNAAVSEDPLIRQATEDLKYFVRGCFHAADQEAARQALPQVVNQMAFQITLRGWLTVRSMMNIKTVEGIDTSFPEIDVWDSMDTAWERDINGLAWMARKRTLPAHFDGKRRDNAVEGILVYEYIDRERYCVVTRDARYRQVTPEEGEYAANNSQTMFVIDPVEHYVYDSEGRKALPGVVLPCGSRTRSHNASTGLDSLAKIGTSVLETLIPVIEQYNLMGTNWLTQELQDTERKMIYRTNAANDETRESIRTVGEDVVITPEEEITPMAGRAGITPNSQALRDLNLAEAELATFTDIISGSTGRNLSGYAIRQLSINARQKIQPSLSAMERGIESISLLLRGHFQTGAFGILERFNGRSGLNDTYFERNIYPDILRFAGGFDIKLRPRREKLIPEDVNTAAQLHTAGILSLRTILNDVLDIDDADEQMRELVIQQISQADPQLAISRAIEAYGETGQYGQAEYLHQIFNLNLQNLKSDLGLQALYKEFQTLQLLAALGRGNPVLAEQAAENLRRLGVTLLGQPSNVSPISVPGGGDPKAESGAQPGPSPILTPLKGLRQFVSERGAQVNQENASLDRGGENGRV